MKLLSANSVFTFYSAIVYLCCARMCTFVHVCTSIYVSLSYINYLTDIVVKSWSDSKSYIGLPYWRMIQKMGQYFSIRLLVEIKRKIKISCYEIVCLVMYNVIHIFAINLALCQTTVIEARSKCARIKSDLRVPADLI